MILPGIDLQKAAVALDHRVGPRVCKRLRTTAAHVGRAFG